MRPRRWNCPFFAPARSKNLRPGRCWDAGARAPPTENPWSSALRRPVEPVQTRPQPDGSSTTPLPSIAISQRGYATMSSPRSSTIRQRVRATSSSQRQRCGAIEQQAPAHSKPNRWPPRHRVLGYGMYATEREVANAFRSSASARSQHPNA